MLCTKLFAVTTGEEVGDDWDEKAKIFHPFCDKPSFRPESICPREEIPWVAMGGIEVGGKTAVPSGM
jgi:hypothetical protein